MGQIDSISEGQRSLGAVSYIGGSSLLGGYGVGCRSRGGTRVQPYTSAVIAGPLCWEPCASLTYPD